MGRGNNPTVNLNADFSAINNALKRMREEIKLSKSEFENATGAMQNYKTSIDGLESKEKQLESSLESRKKALRDIVDVQDKFTRALKESEKELAQAKLTGNIAEIERCEKAVEAYKKAVDDTQVQINKLEASIKQENRQLETNERTLKNARGEMEKYDGTAKDLADDIKTQETKVKDLAVQYERASDKFGRFSKEARGTKGALDEEKDKLNSLRSSLEKAESHTKKLGDETKRAGSKAESAARGGFTVLKGVISNLVTDAARAGIRGLKDVAGDILETGMTYESGMKKVQAVSQGSDADMKKLGKIAREQSKVTKFSADETTQALYRMAQAGYDVKKMEDILPTALQFSAGGDFDLDKATDNITDYQQALELSNKELKIAVDQWSQAARITNTSQEQITDAALRSAQGAKTLSGAYTEQTEILSVLASNSIKGERAGTALRNIIQRLSKSTADARKAVYELSSKNGLEKLLGVAGNGKKTVGQLRSSLQSLMKSFNKDEKNTLLDKLFGNIDKASVNAFLKGKFDFFKNADNSAEVKKLTKEIEAYDDQIWDLSKAYAQAKHDYGTYSDQAKAAKDDLDTAKKARSELNKQLTATKNATGGTAKDLEKIVKALSQPSKAAKQWYDSMGADKAFKRLTRDAKGNLRPVKDIVKEFNKLTKGLGTSEKTEFFGRIFNVRDTEAAKALINTNSKTWDKIIKQIEKDSKGATKKINDTMMDTTEGDIHKLLSNIKDGFITIFEKVSPYIRDLLKKVYKLVSEVDMDDIARVIGDAFKDLGKWIDTISIKDLAQGIVDFVKGVVNGIRTIIEWGKKAFDFISEHWKTILAMFGISKILDWGKSIISIISNIGDTFKSVLGKAGIAGLFAGVIAGAVELGTTLAKIPGEVSAAAREAGKELEKLPDDMADRFEEAQKRLDEITENHNERKTKLIDVDRDIENIHTLIEKYDKLIDKNGKIKKGHKEQADKIKNELCDALGIEKKELDSIIKKNGKIGKELDKQILKKQAMLYLDVYKDDYVKAKKNQGNDIDAYNQALDDFNALEEKYQTAYTNYKNAQKRYNQFVANGGNVQLDEFDPKGISAEFKKASAALSQATWNLYGNKNEGIEGAFAALKKRKEVLDQTNADIQTYQHISDTISRGSTKELKDLIKNLSAGTLTKDMGMSDSKLKEQLDRDTNYFDSLARGVKNGVETLQSTLDDAEKKIATSYKAFYGKSYKSDKELYSKIMTAKVANAGISDLLTDNLKNAVYSGSISDKQKIELDKFFDLGKLRDKATRIGIELPEYIKNGSISNIQKVDDIIKEMKQRIKFDTLSAQLKDEGIDIPKRLSKAISEGTTDVKTAVDKVSKAVKLNKDGKKDEAKKLLNDYASGIIENREKVEKAAKSAVKDPWANVVKNTSKTAKSGAKGNVDAYTGTFGSYVASRKKDIEQDGEGLSKSFVGGATNYLRSSVATSGLKQAVDYFVSFFGLGKYIDQGWANGIASSDASTKAIKAKDKKNQDAMMGDWRMHSPSKLTEQYGEYIDQGLANGINDNADKVKKASSGMAKGSINAMKKTLDIHSPSKVTTNIGTMTAKGFFNGFASEAKKGVAKVKATFYKTIDDFKAIVNSGINSLVSTLKTDFSSVSQSVQSSLYDASVRSVKNSTEPTMKMMAKLTNNIQDVAKQAGQTVLKEMMNLDNYNFTEVAQNATKNFTKSIDKKITYTQNRWNQMIETNLEAYDTKIDYYTKMQEEEQDRLNKALEEVTQKIEDQKSSYLDDFETQYSNRQESLESVYESQLSSLESRRDKVIQNLENQRDKELQAAQKNKSNAQGAIAKQEWTDYINQLKTYWKNRINTEKKNYTTEINNIKNQNELATKQMKEQYEAGKKAADERWDEALEAEKKGYEEQLKISKDGYDKLINEQKVFRDNFSNGTSKFLEVWNEALSEYKEAATELVNSVVNDISTKYQGMYDKLKSKQDSLIDKLKNSSKLFEISGASVLRVQDVKAQTEEIKAYASQLQSLKGKVSDIILEQIAGADMKEGKAFMDYLTGLTDAELRAYDDAVSEKYKIAEQMGDMMYGSEIQDVAKQYQDELALSFENLPYVMNGIGRDLINGLCDGMTENIDYLSQAVQEVCSQLIGEYKHYLDIHSPSKKMMKIGMYTGEGFNIGYTNAMNNVLAGQKRSLAALVGQARSATARVGSAISGTGLGGGLTNNTTNNSSSVVNNYNLVQNNHSPKSLSALDTYQARREQLNQLKLYAGV